MRMYIFLLVYPDLDTQEQWQVEFTVSLLSKS
jgi:hypothetical protein